jgi:hypothetical protein
MIMKLSGAGCERGGAAEMSKEALNPLTAREREIVQCWPKGG